MRSSAPERQVMNLTGTPDIAVKDGRMAIWVATRELYSRPCLGTRVFLYVVHQFTNGNLGVTARREARPKGRLLYFYFWNLMGEKGVV